MAQAVLRGGQDEPSRIVSDEVRTGLIEGARQVTDRMSSQMVGDFTLRAASILSGSPFVAGLDRWPAAKAQSELLPALLSYWESSASKGGNVHSGTLLGGASVIGTFIPHPILSEWC